MNKFRKPHGSGGRDGGRFNNGGQNRPSFEKPAYSRPDGFRREDSQKFPGICSSCGKACELPFRPNGRKPVYCSACFDTHRETPVNNGSFQRREAPVRSFEPRTSEWGIGDLKQQVGAMNTKIDSMLRILETMSRPSEPIEITKKIVPSKTDVVQKDFSKKVVTKKKGPIKR